MKGTWGFDRDPLAALAAGDARLFEAFVAEETGTFLGFFRRLGARAAEAEDLVQDVFLKLFRQANSYQPNGRFEAFALRIARNAWIDASRRSSHRALRSLDAEHAVVGVELASAERPALEVMQHAEEAGRVERALAQLSEGQRLVFELGVVQELPYIEISLALEIPEGTVKSRMFHALRNLKQLLGEDPGAEPRGLPSR